jgi:hypothetical protein
MNPSRSIHVRRLPCSSPTSCSHAGPRLRPGAIRCPAGAGLEGPRRLRPADRPPGAPRSLGDEIPAAPVRSAGRNTTASMATPRCRDRPQDRRRRSGSSGGTVDSLGVVQQQNARFGCARSQVQFLSPRQPSVARQDSTCLGSKGPVVRFHSSGLQSKTCRRRPAAESVVSQARSRPGRAGSRRSRSGQHAVGPRRVARLRVLDRGDRRRRRRRRLCVSTSSLRFVCARCTPVRVARGSSGPRRRTLGAWRACT